MRRLFIMATSIGLGLAPTLAFAAADQQPQIQPQAAAPAIPDGEVNKAGAALRDVANLQQKYQGQMEAAPSNQKQGLSDKANAEAVQAIQSHGLSVQEYSRVIRTAQNDPTLKQRLLDAANKSQ